MKRKVLALALVGLLCLAVGCAQKKISDVKVDKSVVPPAPAEGTVLAKAAEKVPIINGPATPARKALSQDPQARPCWAIPEGKGCPIDKPGFYAFVGTSSGAASKEGAILNAYQNAIERLAAQCFNESGTRSPDAREMIRAKAYVAAGIHDKSYRLRESTWVQKWQERYKDYMRIYYRSFVLLEISKEEMNSLMP